MWHHWGGGGGLLHPGGGPSPTILPADRREPEKEHQMIYSKESLSMTVTCLIYLASLQPVWRPTDVYRIMDAACADLKPLWVVIFQWNCHHWRTPYMARDETTLSQATRNCDGVFFKELIKNWQHISVLHILCTRQLACLYCIRNKML